MKIARCRTTFLLAAVAPPVQRVALAPPTWSTITSNNPFDARLESNVVAKPVADVVSLSPPWSSSTVHHVSPGGAKLLAPMVLAGGLKLLGHVNPLVFWRSQWLAMCASRLPIVVLSTVVVVRSATARWKVHLAAVTARCEAAECAKARGVEWRHAALRQEAMRGAARAAVLAAPTGQPRGAAPAATTLSLSPRAARAATSVTDTRIGETSSSSTDAAATTSYDLMDFALAIGFATADFASFLAHEATSTARAAAQAASS
jgi:hypothetical protein